MPYYNTIGYCQLQSGDLLLAQIVALKVQFSQVLQSCQCLNIEYQVAAEIKLFKIGDKGNGSDILQLVAAEIQLLESEAAVGMLEDIDVGNTVYVKRCV